MRHSGLEFSNLRFSKLSMMLAAALEAHLSLSLCWFILLCMQHALGPDKPKSKPSLLSMSSICRPALLPLSTLVLFFF